jgi:hypothetical protein
MQEDACDAITTWVGSRRGPSILPITTWSPGPRRSPPWWVPCGRKAFRGWTSCGATPQDYDRPYFERWAEAFCDLLAAKGFTSRAEIEARMAAIKAEIEARP